MNHPPVVSLLVPELPVIPYPSVMAESVRVGSLLSVYLEGKSLWLIVTLRIITCSTCSNCSFETSPPCRKVMTCLLLAVSHLSCGDLAQSWGRGVPLFDGFTVCFLGSTLVWTRILCVMMWYYCVMMWYYFVAMWYYCGVLCGIITSQVWILRLSWCGNMFTHRFSWWFVNSLINLCFPWFLIVVYLCIFVFIRMNNFLGCGFSSV